MAFRCYLVTRCVAVTIIIILLLLLFCKSRRRKKAALLRDLGSKKVACADESAIFLSSVKAWRATALG